MLNDENQWRVTDPHDRRKLKSDMGDLGPHATALQRAKIQERITGLRNRITSWFYIQALYIPGTTLLRAEEQCTGPSRSTEIQIYDIRLWLPSEIKYRTACDQVLQHIEWELREAQANDALNCIRQNLRINSFLTKRKKDWARGVKANTRSLNAIQQNLSKMRTTVEKYRAAHGALAALEPLISKSGQWRTVLRDLADEDIRGLLVDGLGEGRRVLSWIWMAPGVFDGGANMETDPSLHDGERCDQIQKTK